MSGVSLSPTQTMQYSGQNFKIPPNLPSICLLDLFHQRKQNHPIWKHLPPVEGTITSPSKGEVNGKSSTQKCLCWLGYGLVSRRVMDPSCWSKKSGDHQLRLVVYPIIYRVLAPSKRWLALGFLNHQQYLKRRGRKQLRHLAIEALRFDFRLHCLWSKWRHLGICDTYQEGIFNEWKNGENSWQKTCCYMNSANNISEKNMI